MRRQREGAHGNLSFPRTACAEGTASGGCGRLFRVRRTRGGNSAPFSLRGKEKAAGGKKKTAKGEFRFSPFAIPLKTTKKRADAPFLDHSRGLVCAVVYFKAIKRDADANWTDRRGSRNTLRLFRLPYVKYSTGVHVTKRICVPCAQETRFDGRPKGVP